MSGWREKPSSSHATAWEGAGPCFPSGQFRGAPVCDNPFPQCPKHHSSRPRLAFVIAGQSRSFLDDRTWLSYFQHVLKSFYANAESRVFLHLKLSRGGGLDRRWSQLGQALDALRPAVVQTTLERDSDLTASLRPLANRAGLL